MHEFSLASEIIDIVSNSVKESGYRKVVKVTLQIGQLSGVEEYALETALNSLIPGTILNGAKFEKLHIQGKALCQDCNMEFATSDFFSLCPNCQSFNKEILTGKEFDIISIDVE